MTYYDCLTEAMTKLAGEPTALFLGQSIAYPGQAMHETLRGVHHSKRLEFPVAEDFQMGYSLGLALTGVLPICIYPRMDFLLLAANQLVNHLDKLPEMEWPAAKVIIRVAVGSTEPVNAGPQHTQDHTQAFASMLRNVRVRSLLRAEQIIPAYESALRRPESTLLIEYASEYYK